MDTIAYIDGFNLYYGCLRNTPHKWLNLQSFLAASLPNNDIRQIRYFTAIVKPRENDALKQVRQQVYLRALGTIPSLTVHRGRFLDSIVSARLANPRPGSDPFAKVYKSEEKGSDVNIATYMMLDAFRNRCEAMVLVSNDSDLVEPVRIVRREFSKKVLQLGPCCNGRKLSYELKAAASRSQVLDSSLLPLHQFPNTLTDSVGEFRKPSGW